MGHLSSGSQGPWAVGDINHRNRGGNFDLIKSNMRWSEVTPGRVAPATWPSGPKYSLPLSNDDWIACQDAIKERLHYTRILPDPSVCKEPPQFCYDNIHAPGCHAQGMWKKDNMWSPRRGLGAASANGKIFVIGGQSREYGRIDNSRLVGGLDGQKRVDTMREYSTIQEDLVLKNDVWSSSDRGASWELVSPGCKDPQEDVLMQTELWSRNHSNPLLPKFVGSIGSKCLDSSDCYGVAECKALGNTPDKVCFCPMFSPRSHHAVAVQHRFSIDKDNVAFSEDVIYVVGGFITVKQAFCANRSCGPIDGYRIAIDDVWMSTDGRNWIQIKSFRSNDLFRGRGSHSAIVVHSYPGSNYTSNNKTEPTDRLLIFGGETFHPRDKSTVYLNDVWKLDLPKEPCCMLARGCSEDWTIQNKGCLPKQSDWSIITPKSKWSKRSGHCTVYEPRSSGNSFNHRIYLIGGINADGVQSDVWTWSMDSDEWKCDFCPNGGTDNATLALNKFLSIDSPLSAIKSLHLPSIGDDGQLFYFTTHSVSNIVNDDDIAVMALKGVKTVSDLATADLYSILNLRGFDFPGRHSHRVSGVCYLRAISIAIAKKCTQFPITFEQLNTPKLPTCGRGGESKPCVRDEWDGCSPIPDVTKVDVHGLGDVTVPQIQQNPSPVLEEIFCRQVPSGRYFSAAAFLDGKVVLLGGIGHSPSRLFRDVWARDESYPQAIITTMPLSLSPQSQFHFDNTESDAVLYEYKLLRDESDILPWTITTKTFGANVDWLDDKKGGPGRGWYSLYVRAVKPSGNRDYVFSTQANVYTWFYIPPIPWGAVSAYVITALVVVSSIYFGYRHHKKRLILQRFQLRRLKRKFKLRAAQQSHLKMSYDRQKVHSRRSATASFGNGYAGMDEQLHSQTRMSRNDQPKETLRLSESTDNPHPRSRPRTMRSEPYEESPGINARRRRIPTTDDVRVGDEAKNRRRRERERLRRGMH